MKSECQMSNDERNPNPRNPEHAARRRAVPFGIWYSLGIRHLTLVIFQSLLEGPTKFLVWCLRNNYTFVALKLAWGEARRRKCIPSDTRPTEQRSPRPISAQPEGRHVFWAEALLLAPHRSTLGYAPRSRLASAQNPLPRMYSYFGDTTLASPRSAYAQETHL